MLGFDKTVISKSKNRKKIGTGVNPLHDNIQVLDPTSPLNDDCRREFF